MSFLLDTNVLSELLRVFPEPAVPRWLAARPAQGLFVSAITQAEMLAGARVLPAGRRRDRLEEALDAMFREDFPGRVLAFDPTAASAYATIGDIRRRAGRPISQFDAQVAAIASCHRLDLATRDVADFEGCGLTVLDPWTSA
jgi:predicted nucleic acid-binding protein